MDYGDCVQTVNDKKIVLKQKRSKITFNNPNNKNVKKIEIDNCVITEGERCDYLIITDDNIEHYIELKGCDVEHALSQITTTIRKLTTPPHNHFKICFIVCTRHPALTPKIQKMKLDLKRKYNARLITKGRQCTFDI